MPRLNQAADAAARLRRARTILDAAEADGLLLSRTASKRWLAGFVLHRDEEHSSGYSGALLVTRQAALVMVDGRYVEQAEAECPGWSVRLTHAPRELLAI